MLLKPLGKQYSFTQCLPLIARSVRMGLQGEYQPTLLHTLSDDSVILFLADKKSIFVQYIVFCSQTQSGLYCPHANTGIQIDEQAREVTTTFDEKTYHLINQISIKEFVQQADLHFYIESMRKRFGETDAKTNT